MEVHHPNQGSTQRGEVSFVLFGLEIRLNCAKKIHQKRTETDTSHESTTFQ